MSQLLKSLIGSSLAGKVMLRVAYRVALVIVVMTAIAYYHVVSTVQEQSLGQLEKYIVERSQRESTIFKLAEDNHTLLKKVLLERLNSLGDSDPVEAFDEKIMRFEDGTLRTRLDGFDGTRQSFVFIGKNVKVDADLRRRVMTFLELSDQYGPAWHHRLQNLYFTAPENLLAGYWPEVPDWAHNLPADIYMPDEEFVWAADKQHNPSRESVWTGVFYDVGANVWMASLETPVDIGERQIATIGHDITLNELFERTKNDKLDDAYNLIIRDDGRLIAHPQMMELIKDKQGDFDVTTSDNLHLKSVYQAIKNRQPGRVVVENKAFDEFLAVGKLEEPGWYFVTVYPRSSVTNPAFKTASVVLLLGLISLFVELIIFYFVLSRGVAKPLSEFSSAVSLVADGHLDRQLDVHRDDELGTLGRVFNHMTNSLQQREDQSRFNTEMASAMTRALSTYVTDRVSARENFNQMLIDILAVTDSEYGFIGEILHNDNKPFLKTHAISDISWDQDSKKLYDEYAEQGLEFHNLDTLFGAAIRSQSVVISNDPANDERSKGLSDGHPPLNSFLGVPLMLGDEMIGMVGVANRKQGYDFDLVNDLSPLFHTCASVINAIRKHNEFKVIKEAIRQQATIIDQIHDAVISTDLDGYIASWNKGAERLFGYSRGDILGKHIAELFSEELHFVLKDEIIDPLQKEGEHEVEVKMRKKSAKDFYAHLSLSMQYDEHGNATGMIAYTIDITDRKQAEAELKRYRHHLEELVEERTTDMQIARDLAERASKAKSDFLSRMSHELRTPLNAILGFGQLLENNPSEPLTELQTENINEIQKAGHHLLALINEILNLSRIESGKMDLTIKAIDIVPIINDCISQLQPLATARDITIKLEFSADCIVKADSMRIKQVLFNLLSNAIKYNRDGGQIRIICGEVDHQRLRVNVYDTGVGIDEDQLPRLFQPFERIDSSQEVVEGTGIGLAVVKKLLEVMDGRIGVESEKGKGSNFWFEIPLSTSTSVEHEDNHERLIEEDELKVELNHHQYKLLYVEDNPANLRLVEKIIESKPEFHLINCTTAEAGLELATQQQPDIILLDISLPGMDGFEAVRRLKKDRHTRDIPVIAVTANAMASDIERGKIAGFDAYITKPINIEEFISALNCNLPIGVKVKR